MVILFKHVIIIIIIIINYSLKSYLQILLNDL